MNTTTEHLFQGNKNSDPPSPNACMWMFMVSIFVIAPNSVKLLSSLKKKQKPKPWYNLLWITMQH